MRIALNLLYLIPGVVGGTEVYARSLLEALAELDADNEYVLFVNREAEALPIPSAPNFRRVVCSVRARRRAARYAWEQIVLPGQLRRERASLVHSLGYVGPIGAPCPHVVTIHDLNYLAHADAMSAARRLLLRFFVERTARAADHVLTISHFSRGEILTHLRLPPGGVTVTHLAARADAGEATPATTRDAIDRYGIRPPYVIAFSSLSRHKNIPRLVAAYAQLAGDVPHSLVLVGHLPAGSEVHAAVQASGVGHRVLATGYVPDADVMPLLAGAAVFAIPSLYEGFGLVALEAQRAGVPVACSNRGALPEVAGAGGVFFDSQSTQEMRAALLRVLRDEGLRAQLVNAGAENLRRYSWKATARATLAVYERVAGASPSRLGSAIRA